MNWTRRVWWLGFVGFASFAGDPLGWTRLFFLLFLVPLVTDLAGAWRAGSLRFRLRLAISGALTYLNPRLRRQIQAQIRGNRAARARLNGREPTPEFHLSAVRFSLPVRGAWLVTNGGPDPESSHSWEIVSQRYAYDLIRVDGSGIGHRQEGTRVEDYLCYGEPILAPADGEVIEVVDGIRDAPRPGSGWLDWQTPSLAGNVVVIRHAETEYSFLAHLIPGSIPVRSGDQVRAGEVIGRCGNSGHSTEPHLHVQLQDSPDFLSAIGLPLRFSDIRIGEGEPGESLLRAGMDVRPALD